uniref:Secreted protein n=1 Tax=Anopheles quadriannulatus TaxID=34691 RepID=A0A182XRL8_ANOQN
MPLVFRRLFHWFSFLLLLLLATLHSSPPNSMLKISCRLGQIRKKKGLRGKTERGSERGE